MTKLPRHRATACPRSQQREKEEALLASSAHAADDENQPTSHQSMRQTVSRRASERTSERTRRWIRRKKRRNNRRIEWRSSSSKCLWLKWKSEKYNDMHRKKWESQGERERTYISVWSGMGWNGWKGERVLLPLGWREQGETREPKQSTIAKEQDPFSISRRWSLLLLLLHPPPPSSSSMPSTLFLLYYSLFLFLSPLFGLSSAIGVRLEMSLLTRNEGQQRQAPYGR